VYDDIYIVSLCVHLTAYVHIIRHCALGKWTNLPTGWADWLRATVKIDHLCLLLAVRGWWQTGRANKHWDRWQVWPSPGRGTQTQPGAYCLFPRVFSLHMMPSLSGCRNCPIT
jgi:hypothetical protein